MGGGSPYRRRTPYSAAFRIILLGACGSSSSRLRHCRCRRRLDVYGDHHAACSRSGHLRARGAPLERAAARVCREAGATVATNVLLRDLNARTISASRSLPMACLRGAASSSQLKLPWSRLWTRRASHVATNDVHKEQPSTARRAKERTYPELLNSPRCRLVVLALEIGGRSTSMA